MQQHTTAAPRETPARWRARQFMHSHARFIDSARNQKAQVPIGLSAHESAPVEVLVKFISILALTALPYLNFLDPTSTCFSSSEHKLQPNASIHSTEARVYYL